MALRKRGHSWQVDVTMGRTCRVREDYATYEEARKREAELRAEYLAGKRVRGRLSGSTFGEAVALWLEEVQRTRERATYDYYNTMVTPATHVFGTVPLARLGRRQVMEYVGHVQKATSPVTAKKTLGAIQTAVRWAVANELVESSPVITIPLPKVSPVRRCDVLTEAEWIKVMAVPKTWKERGIVLLLAHAGLRRGEVRAFAADWLNWDDRAIVIPVSAQYRPKSKRPRPIPLSPDLETWARAWPENRWYLLDGNRDVAQIRRLVERCQGVLNAKPGQKRKPETKGGKKPPPERRLTPHILRHSYASLLDRSGVALADIRDVLGHTDVATTARYVHSLPGHVERVRGAVWPVTTNVTTQRHRPRKTGTSAKTRKANKTASVQEMRPD